MFHFMYSKVLDLSGKQINQVVCHFMCMISEVIDQTTGTMATHTFCTRIVNGSVLRLSRPIMRLLLLKFSIRLAERSKSAQS
jgi:hypothetical protein